ncbi:MAG: hypothetical protein HY606_01120, partial [Planctomycetes bacterium]|nr:hypothetical protein [Planctomycetota bacterium]
VQIAQVGSNSSRFNIKNYSLRTQNIRIQRSESASFTNVTEFSETVPRGPIYGFVDNTLAPETRYYYRAYARLNGTTQSVMSSVIEIFTSTSGGDPNSPEPPGPKTPDPGPPRYIPDPAPDPNPTPVPNPPHNKKNRSAVCFIVTASSNGITNNVQNLVSFRNSYLRIISAGSIAVKIYENASPSVAFKLPFNRSIKSLISLLLGMLQISNLLLLFIFIVIARTYHLSGGLK